MNYHNITYPDMNNGSGLRVVLWLSGCKHHCKGCQNPQTWNPESGIEFDELAEQELFRELDKEYISGITFSGGDPLMHPLQIYLLSDKIRKKYGNKKTIWIYTGYTWNEILTSRQMTKAIVSANVVVDGEYKEELRSPNLPWVGSSNQRVIDVQQSLFKGEIVLWAN